MAEEVIINPFLEEDLSDASSIIRTYKMDFEKKRIVGIIDDEAAVKQALLKAMMTRRFAYMIYDDQYGCDIMNKVGRTSLTKDYLDSDIPVMLEDMTLPDETIIGISNVEYEMINSDSVYIRFVAHSIYGEENIEGVIANE